MPEPVRPGRQGTGSPLHPAWQRRWRRQPALAAWHRGAHRSPARLSCASSPHPSACYSAAARPGSASSAPLLPRAWCLWESGERQGAAFAFAGTPPSGQRGKGREGTGKFWIARRGVGSAVWLWRDVLTEVLGAFCRGSLPVKADTADSWRKSSTELCSAGLEKCSRLVTTAFSERQII